jgi:hypothetical protein
VKAPGKRAICIHDGEPNTRKSRYELSQPAFLFVDQQITAESAILISPTQAQLQASKQVLINRAVPEIHHLG